MIITTEEAERLAIILNRLDMDRNAAALRALAAERDALTIRYVTEMKARFKAEAEFSHMQLRIARQRRALAKLYGKRHDKNGRLSNFLAGMKAENARLREGLRLAIDAVEFWSAYASPYFQDKHDLAEDLQKLRAAQGETR
jgi:hypothetical protein